MKLKVEYFIGLFSIVIGALVLFMTRSFPAYLTANSSTGPDFFPNLIAIILMVVGIGEFFEARNSVKTINFRIADKRAFINIVVVIIAIITYILVLPILGFVFSSFLFSILVMMLLNVKFIKSLIFSLVLVGILFLIFSQLFRVPLPQSILF